MKAVILAGGRGTRLSEHTHLIPKPLVHVGSKPILLHIMDIFIQNNVTEFIILLGYKSELVKEYFLNLNNYLSDVKITFDTATTEILSRSASLNGVEVTLIDTGLDTMTGGRIARIEKYINPGEDFFLTYGDAVANVDLDDLLSFHIKRQAIATVTGVQPPGRFGTLQYDPKTNQVQNFLEKPKGDGHYINGGFFVFSSKIFEYLSGDDCVLEQEPLSNLANDGSLYIHRHDGYWQCMDNIRDLEVLQRDVLENPAPWLIH